MSDQRTLREIAEQILRWKNSHAPILNSEELLERVMRLRDQAWRSYSLSSNPDEYPSEAELNVTTMEILKAEAKHG